MLRGVGTLFVASGLALGAALVLGPLGLAGLSSGAAPSILFAVLAGCGTLLFAIAARLRPLRTLGLVLGGGLLLLAAGSAAGLARLLLSTRLDAEGAAQVSTVLVVSGMLGAVCLRTPRGAPPS